MDLLYVGIAENLKKATFEMLEAKDIVETVSGDWDEIHEHRLSVVLKPEACINNYYKLLIKKGWASCSLTFGLFVMDEPEEAKKLIAEVKGTTP